MPVTPLHMGLPGLVSYFWPGKVDIFTALLGSVLVDIDFFLFLLQQTPLHGFLHSFLGATLLALLLIVVVRLAPDTVRKIKSWFRWETDSNLGSVAIGAFLGAYSHVLLDSFLYSDMKPFQPFSGNPFLPEEGTLHIRLIYVITGVSTFLLLALYVMKYGKAVNEEKTRTRSA